MNLRNQRLLALGVTIALLLGGLNLATAASVVAPAVSARHADDNGNEHDDNQGNSGNDKEKKDKKDKENNGNKKGEEETVPVEQGASYSISVTCQYQQVDDLTTCDFSASALAGAKKVGQLVVPESGLCADVSGGTGKLVDPDPHAHVRGYRSEGSPGQLSLVLQGQVTVNGVATYWVKAGGTVLPIRGPGLTCLTLAPAATPPPSEISDSTGALVVQTYSCAIAAPIDGFDWFGACTPAGNESTFRLSPQGGTGNADLTGATHATGQTTFANLAPGLYDLTRVNKTWCHAESDNVDSTGNVVIKAGERTTVWVFSCDGAGNS